MAVAYLQALLKPNILGEARQGLRNSYILINRNTKGQGERERVNHYDHLSLVWVDSVGYFGRPDPPRAHLVTPVLEANNAEL